MARKHFERGDMSRTIRMTVAGALVLAACATAFAQQAQTMRVRGTIAKVDGDALTLKGATAPNTS